jgi:hypothetical protein
MALSQYTIAEVRQNGTSTGAAFFDPGQYAGMYTDGAATSANTVSPVFSSASYNFVAGDVGAWVYIYAGTNWTPGWYKIASVASNVATLNGTIGQAVKLTTTGTIRPDGPSTVIGCATTGSPTGATWSIDYSQQDAVAFTYTDLASAGAGLTVSSAAQPFNKQHVGNGLNITSGTNFTAGRYVIASVTANVATVVGAGNITTGAGSGGNGKLGGALNTLGNLPTLQSGTYIFISGTFTGLGSDTWSAATYGTFTLPIKLSGYKTTRGDGIIGRDKSTGLLNVTNCANLAYTGNNLFNCNNTTCLIIDSLNMESSATSNTAIISVGSYSVVSFCKFSSATTSGSAVGIGLFTYGVVYNCDVIFTGATGSYIGMYFQGGSTAVDCYIKTASATSYCATPTTTAAINFTGCVFSGNGFGVGAINSANSITCLNCTFYGLLDGLKSISGLIYPIYAINCMFTDCSGYAFNIASNTGIRVYGIRYRDNALGNFSASLPNVDATNFNAITLGGGGARSDYSSPGSANPLGYTLIPQSPAYGAGTFGANLGALPKGASPTVLPTLTRGNRRKKI